MVLFYLKLTTDIFDWHTTLFFFRGPTRAVIVSLPSLLPFLALPFFRFATVKDSSGLRMFPDPDFGVSLLPR